MSKKVAASSFLPNPDDQIWRELIPDLPDKPVKQPREDDLEKMIDRGEE